MSSLRSSMCYVNMWTCCLAFSFITLSLYMFFYNNGGSFSLNFLNVLMLTASSLYVVNAVSNTNFVFPFLSAALIWLFFGGGFLPVWRTSQHHVLVCHVVISFGWVVVEVTISELFNSYTQNMKFIDRSLLFLFRKCCY